MPDENGKTLTGDELLTLVDDLFKYCKNVNVEGLEPRQRIIRKVFSDLNQYMKNGTNLRELVDVVNELNYHDAKQRNLFGQIYEEMLKLLQSAGSAGEFYTPRAVTKFIVEMLNPAHVDWLSKFETDSTAILNPMEKPLPFTPFKDFTGRPVNEIHLYSTTLANAICAISSAKIGALMDNRLSEAIINAYKVKNQKPITFQEVFDHYTMLMPEKKQGDMDSVKSVLNQLILNNIFAEEDKVDLVKGCYIINLGKFDKEGIMAKAIVYFVTSKLNNIYEQLPPQAKNEDRVELRHFTIIDEAHYMLGFENKPLQNLIAVGRNKGMSIILATQNMDSFKKASFDFYANAQYPLIMKQQQQNDGVLKDLFGVSGVALQELKQAIAGLQKGELITKDAQAMALGIGKHWKKIKVTHLI